MSIHTKLVLSISGPPASGKTYILKKITPLLEAEGFKVSGYRDDYENRTESIELSIEFTPERLFQSLESSTRKQE